MSDGTAEPGQATPKPEAGQPQSPGKASPKSKTRKSYKAQRELDQLMAQIEMMEQRQAQLEAEMAEPGFFEKDYSMVEQATLELAELNAKLEKAFARWDELEGET